jgi:hypothetical protein
MQWLDSQRWFGGSPNPKCPDLPSLSISMHQYMSVPTDPNGAMRCTTVFGAVEGAGTEVYISRKSARQWRWTVKKSLSSKGNGPVKPKTLQ